MRKRIARRIAWGLLPALTLFTARPIPLVAAEGIEAAGIEDHDDSGLGGGLEITGTPTPTATPTPTSTPQALPTCETSPPGVSCCIAGTGGNQCIVGTSGDNCPEPPLPVCTTGSCGGDCNADGTVTVDELVRGVNIGLLVQDVSVCPAMDVNGNGEVTVDELVRAVNNALNGCPQQVAALERRRSFAVASREHFPPARYASITLDAAGRCRGSVSGANRFVMTS